MVETQVILIDRRNHHLFQPLLYQVATSVLSPGQSSRLIVNHRESVTAASCMKPGVPDAASQDLVRCVSGLVGGKGT